MKKRILSCLLSIAMCLTLLPLGIQAQAAYFGDVTSHWARSYIEDAVDMGLFNGTAPNRFEPESAMTRAMFVTVLYRMDGGEAERSANFIDVPRGSWYSDAVAWASENSIVTGTSAIRFSPNDSVTREQMVTILNRYLTASGAALGSDGEAPAISFRDSSSIAPYAREAVEKMQRASIVSGKPSGFGYRFDPQGCATRAEVACIMCKFLDQLSYDDIDNEEPDPEAAYEQMDKITQSSTLKSLSSQYENASDSQKKNLAEQAISYFEQQEENGTIDYCDVDRENGVISYAIDGCEFAYFLYDVSSEGMTDGTRSPLVDTSSQSAASSLTISPNTVSYASNLVGAAPSNKKALILDYYSASSSDPYASHFHKFSQEAEERYKAVGYTPKTIYGFTIADLKSGLDQYNLMLFNTHGALLNNTPVVCLSEPVTSKNRANYKTDIKDGNVIIATNINTKTYEYCIAPQFFTAHYKYLNTSWIHLDLCKGFGGNNELVETLSSLTVNNITGFGDTVPTYFANYCFANLLDYMADQYQLKDCIDYADTASRKQYIAAGDKNSHYLVCPKLQLYGKGWLKLTEVEDHYGRIRIALNPDVGTITSGTYSLYCVRSDLTEELLYDGKSFTTSAFEITGLQDALYYRIVIKVPNYDSAEAKIMAVEYPKDTNIPITYNPPKPLTPVVFTTETEITVRDLDNKALKNASVTLYGKKKDSSTFFKLTSGTTDSSGKLTIAKVDISYTTLKAEASLSGYISGSTEQSFAGQGKNKRYIEVTLDTEKSLEPDDSKYDDYTKVSTVQEFNAAILNNEKILLTADLRPTATEEIKSASYFNGILDGNGHTIYSPSFQLGKTNLSSTWSWIRTNYGSITNVKFDCGNLSFTGSNCECGLIHENHGTISNCVLAPGSLTAEGDRLQVSGFVYINLGSIKNCVNMMDITVNATQYAYAAGLTVENFPGDSLPGRITHCLNLGNIEATSSGTNAIPRASGIAIQNKQQRIQSCGNGGAISTTVNGGLNPSPNVYSIAPNSTDDYIAVDGVSDDYYNSTNGITYVSLAGLRNMWSDVLN